MWRCRQCGWAMEAELARLPRYGARLRCPACHALLPPALRDPDDSRDLRPADVAGAADSPSPADLRAEARAMIRPWLETVQGSSDRVTDDAALFRDHGEAIAQLMDRWRAKHPGEEARTLFREVLFGLLDPDPDVAR